MGAQWVHNGCITGASTHGDGLGPGGDLVPGGLLSYGHVHVGHVAQEVHDARTGRRQLSLRVENAHQESTNRQTHSVRPIDSEFITILVHDARTGRGQLSLRVENAHQESTNRQTHTAIDS